MTVNSLGLPRRNPVPIRAEKKTQNKVADQAIVAGLMEWRGPYESLGRCYSGNRDSTPLSVIPGAGHNACIRNSASL
jgi:hypothetical protein